MMMMMMITTIGMNVLKKKSENKLMWNVKCFVIPVITGAIGNVTKRIKYL